MEFFKNFHTALCLPKESVCQCELALEEILVNIIHYAYPDGNPGDLELRLGYKDNQLTFETRDSGVEFDSCKASTPDTSIPVEERQIGGLGIHLVRNIVDNMSYRRENDRNILTMMKDFS